MLYLPSFDVGVTKDLEDPSLPNAKPKPNLSSVSSMSGLTNGSSYCIRTQPRLDLNGEALFKLSLFSIYLSPNTTVVASVLNQRLKPQPRLTTDDVIFTYLYLHDNEHPMWTRARDMNRLEKKLLKSMLAQEGVEKELLEVDTIRPVGPVGCLRTSSMRDMLDRYLAAEG